MTFFLLGLPIVHLNSRSFCDFLFCDFPRSSPSGSQFHCLLSRQPGTIMSSSQTDTAHRPATIIGLGNRPSPDLVGAQIIRSLPCAAKRPQIALTVRQGHTMNTKSATASASLSRTCCGCVFSTRTNRAHNVHNVVVHTNTTKQCVQPVFPGMFLSYTALPCESGAIKRANRIKSSFHCFRVHSMIVRTKLKAIYCSPIRSDAIVCTLARNNCYVCS